MQLKRDTLLERGKYRILETLGRGGFGITYLAEQVMTRRKVCIKEYFPKDYYNRDADTNRVYIGSQVSPEAMHKYKEKFIKEASVLAHLKHPHIVSVYDVFEENDTAYYVMEYVEGESLNAFVKRCGALDETKAVGYIRQIADALGYIHEQNINHLDVKPGNVMVSSEDDGAILIDFGLAKHYDAVGEQTSSTPVGISHGYAPIEQYTSGGVREFSPSTDIYGLGATLYFLVTGEVPPHATDVGEEGLPKLPDHLSHGVCQAIIGSMQYWRKDRPQGIKEFLKLLDDEQGVVAPVAEATIINVEPKAVDESTVINVKPKQTPQPAPQPKNEPKPKKSKKGLWLGIFLFVVAAVASFILFGGGSKESAPKSAVATVDTLASSNDSLNLAKPGVDTLQLNDTPKEQPKEEAKPSEANTETETQPEPPTKEPKEEAKPSETKPVTKPEPPTKEDAKTVTQSNNEIWYTSSDGKVVKPSKEGKDIFGAEIESNTYKDGKGIIKFNGDVTTIGESAFRYCESLTSVTIPNSVTTIGIGAFEYCRNLTSVTIPNSVTTIGEWAFCDCDNLTSVTIPNSVTTIGDNPFVYCSNLKEFKGKFAADNGRCLIVDGVLNSFAIGCGATDYTIPNTVTEIGESAFSSCNLTSITIPNSVTTIGKYAFWSCSNLTSVTIPNSVTKIGERAFVYCSSIKEFKSKFASPDGRCLIINRELVAFAPAGITEYTIPNSVTTIGYGAFCDCYNLTNVTIPNSVTTIGENAFIYCRGLTSVTIPNSVTTIGGCAFWNCFSLKSVTIPNSVTTIGWAAFWDCESLTSVTIPNSVTKIGERAFASCDSLKEFKSKFASPDGRCLIVNGKLVAFAPAGITEYTIPYGVTTIGECAFYYCKSLTSVTIPNSVTTIGKWAFSGCKNLTSVTIPDSVTTIGVDAFQNCDNLSEETKNQIKSINSNVEF